MRFTDCYAASPVCTSARAALLTGCYPRRNGMHEFDWDGSVFRPISPAGLHTDEITLAETLREQGYATHCIGKWHLGDQRAFLPLQHGFDDFFGLLYSDEMDDQYTMYNWPPMPLLRGNEVVEAPADLDTMTRRYTEDAIRFVRKNRDRPFFLYLPHMSPGSRTEPIAGLDFRGVSANGKYGDCIEELDDSTGQLLAALREAGIDQNTLVIWTADNGAPPPRGTEHHGSNHPFAKRKAYDGSEGGLRVACIARWPGQIPARSACSELITQMDFFPTLTELAGGKVPDDRVIDGKNIWPLFVGEPNAKSPHEAFFYYFGGQLQGVRSGEWKLTLALEEPLTQLGMGKLGVSVSGRSSRKFGDPVPARLVRINEDPHEQNNLADQHPDIVQRLLDLAEQARADLGDIDREGNNTRPCGLVENPHPQLLKK